MGLLGDVKASTKDTDQSSEAVDAHLNDLQEVYGSVQRLTNEQEQPQTQN